MIAFSISMSLGIDKSTSFCVKLGCELNLTISFFSTILSAKVYCSIHSAAIADECNKSYMTVKLPCFNLDTVLVALSSFPN